MKSKILIALAVISIMILSGCGAPESQTGKGMEEPPEFDKNQEPYVSEQVVTPPAPPEPEEDESHPEENKTDEPETQEDEAPQSVLNEHRDSRHFLHGNPDVGESISSYPRKVDVVFKYPIGEGTEIQVWDEKEENRFDDGNTILADTDLLVAIVYLENMKPGIYKVKYHADFVTDKEGEDDGYYYFLIKE